MFTVCSPFVPRRACYSPLIIHPKRVQDLYDINVTDTKNVLEEAIASRASRLVLVSRAARRKPASPLGVRLESQAYSSGMAKRS